MCVCLDVRVRVAVRVSRDGVPLPTIKIVRVSSTMGVGLCVHRDRKTCRVVSVCLSVCLFVCLSVCLFLSLSRARARARALFVCMCKRACRGTHRSAPALGAGSMRDATRTALLVLTTSTTPSPLPSGTLC